MVEEKGTVREGKKKRKRFKLKQSRRHGLEKKAQPGSGHAWENMTYRSNQRTRAGPEVRWLWRALLALAGGLACPDWMRIARNCQCQLGPIMFTGGSK